MGIGRDGEPKLLEDARYVLLDAPIGQEDAGRDRRVRQSFGHQLEHLSFSGTQLADWIVTASPADELRDDARIERGAAVGDAPHGGDEVRQVVHAVLQQVTDSFSALLEKLELVKNLELFEEEHAEAEKEPQRQP